MSEVLKAQADSFEVSDLDTFVKLLFSWHESKVKMLEHLLTIPDADIEVILQDQTKALMSGEYHKGFLLGLNVALGELGKLPFGAELEDGPALATDTANEQTQP